MNDSTPLTCKQVVELATDYLEGALDRHTCQQFEDHLAVCPDCGAYLDQVRQTINVLGAVAPEQLSPATRDGLMKAFSDILPPRGQP